MSGPLFRRVLPVVLVLPLAAFAFGGWAIVSVEDLPEHAVVGQPVNLSFAVRQHGVSLLGGLEAKVHARSNLSSFETPAKAHRFPKTGYYNAPITFPKAGDWTLTIESGFMRKRTTLLPIRVVDAGSKPLAKMTEVERGQRLFVAKDCVSCHVHDRAGRPSDYSMGPELTDRSFAPDYLSKYLENPSAVRKPAPNKMAMPSLELKPAEIASLVAFINADSTVASK